MEENKNKEEKVHFYKHLPLLYKQYKDTQVQEQYKSLKEELVKQYIQKNYDVINDDIALDFIRIYKFIKMTAQERQDLVDIFLRIVLDIENSTMNTSKNSLRLLIKLLKKGKSELKIDVDWRLLYKLLDSIINQTLDEKSLSSNSSREYAKNVNILLSHLRYFIKHEDVKDIFEEFKDYLVPTTQDDSNAMLFWALLLPRNFENNEYKVWLDDLMAYWKARRSSASIESSIVYIMVGLSKNHMEIDWTPYLGFIMSMFQRKLTLTNKSSMSKFISNMLTKSDIISNYAKFFVNIIRPRKNVKNEEDDVLGKFEVMMNSVKVYFHNLKENSKVAGNVHLLMDKITSEFCNRVRQQRLSPHKVPEASRLDKEDIERFVDILIPHFRLGIFTKNHRDKLDHSLKRLAFISPNKILEEFIPLLFRDTNEQTTLANINLFKCLYKMVLPLIYSQGYKDKYRTLRDILNFGCEELAGTDLQKNMHIIKMLGNIFRFLPIMKEGEMQRVYEKENKDGDYITYMEDKKTENEDYYSYYDLLDWLEEYATLLFDRILSFFTYIEAPTGDKKKGHNANDTFVSSLKTMLNSFFNAIDPSIHKKLVERFVKFLDESVWPNAIDDIGIVVREMAKRDGAATASVILPHLYKKLVVEESGECKLSDMYDDKLNWYIAVFKGILKGGRSGVKGNLKEFNAILRCLLESDKKNLHKQASIAIGNTLASLIRFEEVYQFPINKKDWANAQYQLDFYDNFGQFNVKNYSIEWKEPQQDDFELLNNILTTYYDHYKKQCYDSVNNTENNIKSKKAGMLRYMMLLTQIFKDVERFIPHTSKSNQTEKEFPVYILHKLAMPENVRERLLNFKYEVIDEIVKLSALIKSNFAEDDQIMKIFAKLIKCASSTKIQTKIIETKMKAMSVKNTFINRVESMKNSRVRSYYSKKIKLLKLLLESNKTKFEDFNEAKHGKFYTIAQETYMYPLEKINEILMGTLASIKEYRNYKPRTIKQAKDMIEFIDVQREKYKNKEASKVEQSEKKQINTSYLLLYGFTYTINDLYKYNDLFRGTLNTIIKGFEYEFRELQSVVASFFVGLMTRIDFGWVLNDRIECTLLKDEDSNFIKTHLSEFKHESIKKEETVELYESIVQYIIELLNNKTAGSTKNELIGVSLINIFHQLLEKDVNSLTKLSNAICYMLASKDTNLRKASTIVMQLLYDLRVKALAPAKYVKYDKDVQYTKDNRYLPANEENIYFDKTYQGYYKPPTYYKVMYPEGLPCEVASTSDNLSKDKQTLNEMLDKVVHDHSVQKDLNLQTNNKVAKAFQMLASADITSMLVEYIVMSNSNASAEQDEAGSNSETSGFKYMYADFFYKLFEYAGPHSFELIRDKVEEFASDYNNEHEQATSAEIIAAYLRSHKRINARQNKEFRDFCIKTIIKAFENTSVEHANIWHDALKYILASIDPRRFRDLLDALTQRNPFEDSSFFCITNFLKCYLTLDTALMHRSTILFDRYLSWIQPSLKNGLLEFESTQINNIFISILSDIAHYDSLNLREPVYDEKQRQKIYILDQETRIYDILAHNIEYIKKKTDDFKNNVDSLVTVKVNLMKMLNLIIINHRVVVNHLGKHLLLLMSLAFTLQSDENVKVSEVAALAIKSLSSMKLRGELEEQLFALLKSFSTLDKWLTREAVCTIYLKYSEKNFLRDVVFFDEISQFLYDSNHNVRENASMALQDVIVLTKPDNIPKYISKLKKAFVDEAKKKDPDLVKLHGEVLGLSSVILSYPHDIKEWMPELLSFVSIYKNKFKLVGETIRHLLSQFWKTRQMTWKFDREKFTAEQQSDLQDFINPYNYFS